MLMQSLYLFWVSNVLCIWLQSSRKELVEDIEDLKRKVTGASTEESF
jgi:hypothetical protein